MLKSIQFYIKAKFSSSKYYDDDPTNFTIFSNQLINTSPFLKKNAFINTILFFSSLESHELRINRKKFFNTGRLDDEIFKEELFRAEIL